MNEARMDFSDEQVEIAARALTHAEYGLVFDDFNEEEREIAMVDARAMLDRVFEGVNLTSPYFLGQFCQKLEYVLLIDKGGLGAALFRASGPDEIEQLPIHFDVRFGKKGLGGITYFAVSHIGETE